MPNTIIRLLLTLLLCCLPVAASAATSIHVEWGYTPPTTPAVTGFKLYQEGNLACQTENPNATAMDCQVTLTATTTNFTLTATFSDSTESPQSAPFAFTAPATTEPPIVSGKNLATFTWEYPNTATITGFRVYQNSALICQTADPVARQLACTLNIDSSNTYGLTAVNTDGTETSLSNILTYAPDTTTNDTALQAMITADTLNGPAPLAVNFNANASTGTISTFLWDLGDGTTATGNTVSHTYVTAGTYTVTLTISGASGQTSIATATVTVAAITASTPLQAVITADTLNGPAPLAVNFNANSSTGTISTFLWDFGDGATSAGTTVSHAYTVAGAYTVKLTVTGASGQTNIATATVTAAAPIVPPAPPTAVLSSSTAAGQAPLTVNFNGSGSTAATGDTIASYAWSFGDGSSATGATISHTFATAGTYNTTLTVTDSKGLTGFATTPIVVTAAPVAVNQAPTAVVNATPLTGTAPLAVSFDASGSTDADGTIASYLWNFGDGSTATGKTATHTYTTEANFAATLQVIDNQGAQGFISTTITVQAKPQAATLNIEMGEIPVSSSWVRVPLTSTFLNPVVIAGPPGSNDTDPCVIRLRNVDKTGFDIRLVEWNYQDGTHQPETVTYLVMEKGRITLPDGTMVEAGTFTGTTSFKTVPFSAAFAKAPVVVTTVASANEADTISGRVKTIGLANFAYYFREQEKNINKHVSETVNFLAWEPGKGSLGAVQYEAATTANGVTQAWYNATFQAAFDQPPLLLADMQTTNNTDTSALRVQKVTGTNFQVKVEEEKSKDTEVTHPVEAVGYLALSQAEERALANFTWDFDTVQEASITGFQILVNGDQICATNSASARQLDCEITRPTDPTAFTIQTIEKTGGTSTPSNTIIYTP